MTFYKKKYWAFGGICVFIIAFFIIFKFILPPPRGNIYREDEFLTFSRESGFYDEPFELELTAKSGTIYYTLDGSLPDKNSIKYENPILITDATNNDNVYAMRTDVSTGFDEEAIHSLDPIPGYQVPDHKIDKATIVRAVACDAMGHYSKVQSASYFVGFSEKDGYKGLKILSMITDPSNLFDYETGIYVTGKAYDDYTKEYRGTGEYYWREEYWSMWLANYRYRGVKWEREAECHFFDETGQLVLKQACGIRVHGDSSRAYNPKSLNIYARKEYDGNQKFQSDLFGTGYYASAITLFQGGNDSNVKVKDYLVACAIQDLNISTMHFVPYALFLDGEYWGVYWLNEKVDSQYLQYYYDVSDNNVIMIKEGSLEAGAEEDYKYYANMINFCSKSDVTEPENYQKVCELIDIESYIDYYAVMLYLGRNSDWPSGNFALWRTAKKEDGLYGDGKWRWIIFDLNSSGFAVDFDSIGYVMENDTMFRNLMTNDFFRAQLFLKIENIADCTFHSEAINSRLNEFQNFMADPMMKNNKRFYGSDSLSNFYEEIENLRNFFAERKAYVTSMLNHYR